MKLGRKSGSSEKWKKGNGASNKSIEERFWEKVDKKSDDECWEWKAFIHPTGYGNIAFNGRMISAHRLSWILTYGNIPEGLSVLHTCDNRKCVNPNHLFLGTYKDNAIDRDNKHRGKIPDNSGMNNGNRKLDKEDVLKIRANSNIDPKILARRFKVTTTTIYDIIRHRSWKSI